MCVRPPSPPRIHPSMGMWLVCTSWRLSRVLQGTGEGMGLLQRTCVRTYAPGRDGRVAGSWFSTEVSERPPHWCPEWLCQRTRPPTLEEGALCATPTAASVLGRLATDGHSPRCEVVPRQQFGFALLDTRHTRGGEHGLGHVLLGHLHILWGERSFRVFGPFVEWAVAFVGP